MRISYADNDKVCEGQDIDSVISSTYQQSGTTTVKSLVLLCESIAAVEGTKSYVVVRPQEWLNRRIRDERRKLILIFLD